MALASISHLVLALISTIANKRPRLKETVVEEFDPYDVLYVAMRNHGSRMWYEMLGNGARLAYGFSAANQVDKSQQQFNIEYPKLFGHRRKATINPEPEPESVVPTWSAQR